jgi:hypothetical protein
LEIFGFSHGEQRQISVVTTAETVQSLNLPRENVPADFNGAIGRFTMSMTAGPTNLAAGDPITVKVQITGRGSLDSLNLPDQPAWHAFKAYPPTTKIETADPHGLQGTKTFEQVITPQSADIKALPPMSFSFFDPDAKTYRTLTQPAIPLSVHPGGPSVAPTVVGGNEKQQENTPASQDIVPNKQRLGTLAQVASPLVEQPWFLALQGLPVLALVWAAVVRRRSETLANNPRLRRQREAAVILERGLKDLRKAAISNDSDAFFLILTRLLQEQLGERLNVPSSSITEAVIDEQLRPRGVPDTVLNPLQELFQLSNLARYAPIKSSQELNALIPKLDGVLTQLKKLKL